MTTGATTGATTAATTGASRVAVGAAVGADVALVIAVRVPVAGSVAAEINVPRADRVRGDGRVEHAHDGVQHVAEVAGTLVTRRGFLLTCARDDAFELGRARVDGSVARPGEQLGEDDAE